MAVVEETVQVAARFPKELADALQEKAEADDRTFSYMLRQAVREFVDKDSEPAVPRRSVA